MSPSQSRFHQKILGNLYRESITYLKDKTCEVYPVPFDARLAYKKKACDFEIDTVVQHDISVICDKSKLDDRGCIGARTCRFKLLDFLNKLFTL